MLIGINHCINLHRMFTFMMICHNPIILVLLVLSGRPTWPPTEQKHIWPFSPRRFSSRRALRSGPALSTSRASPAEMLTFEKTLIFTPTWKWTTLVFVKEKGLSRGHAIHFDCVSSVIHPFPRFRRFARFFARNTGNTGSHSVSGRALEFHRSVGPPARRTGDSGAGWSGGAWNSQAHVERSLMSIEFKGRSHPLTLTPECAVHSFSDPFPHRWALFGLGGSLDRDEPTGQRAAGQVYGTVAKEDPVPNKRYTPGRPEGSGRCDGHSGGTGGGTEDPKP